ncbi:hypothetical protein ACO0LO_09350 [Undibacterium sp. TJN25]|uniref:hypothetical protein n=1 Tax=Undibacterium sp. TJN25 TaxID=3413056 RepID=UPI003BF0365C
MIIGRRALGFRLSIYFLALLNSGCVSLNRSSTDLDLETSGANGVPAFAGELGEAIRQANIQRNAYFDAVDRRVMGRQALGVGLIALSAVAVYRGAAAATDGQRDWLTRAGAIGAGAYTAGQFASNNPADEAFLDGYRAISCSILRVRPLLFDTRTEQSGAGPLSLPDFNSDITALKAAVDETDRQLSKRQVQYDRYKESLQREMRKIQRPVDAATLKNPKASSSKKDGADLDTNQTDASIKVDDGGYGNNIKKEFAAVVRELQNARALLKKGTALQQRVATSGFALRRRVELVVANVAGTVQKNQPDLPKLAVTLKTISDTANSFSDLKPVPVAAADAADDVSTSSAAEAPAAKNSAGSGGGAASQCKAPAPAVDAAPASTTEVKTTETTVKGGVSTTTEKTIKTTVTKPEARKSGTETKITVTVAINPDRLEGYLTLDQRKELRNRLSKLYVAHNHLNYRMAAFQEIVKSIKNIPVCDIGNGVALKVVPDTEELKAQAGQKYKFFVSGGIGIPKIALLNAPNAKDTDGLQLTTSVDDGQVVATLSVPQDAKAGEVTLHISDGEGLQDRDISINVEACTPPAGDKNKDKT